MSDTALVIVDAQRHLLEGPGAVPNALLMVARLRTALDAARANGQLVIHVQNDGAEGSQSAPDRIGWELYFEPHESEWVVRKTTPDLFDSNPALAAELAAAGVGRVVVVGMQSEFCLQETSLGAVEAGFDVRVPSALHTTYDGARPASEIAAEAELVMTAAGVTII